MNSFHDIEYKKLLDYVLKNGIRKGDRTKTGTISAFCPPRCVFDLSDGSVPLLTIKKMNTNSIVHELLWYISGESNITYLRNNRVNIWNQWADSDTGDLGPVYGYLWRSFPPSPEPQLIKTRTPTLQPKDDYVFNPIDDSDHVLNSDKDLSFSILLKMKQIWIDIIDACQRNSFSDAQVDPQWQTFSKFVESVSTLPNFIEFKRAPNLYTLSNKYYSSSNKHFLPSMCVWIKNEDHSLYSSETNDAYVCHDGRHYSFLQGKDDLRSYIGLNDNLPVGPEFDNLINRSNVTKVNGKYFVNRGDSDYVVRKPLHVDQLQQVIDQIKTNPNSRRHMITAWHPSLLPAEDATPNQNPQLGKQALPACHYQMQFYVRDQHLDLLLNMRSNDLFIGAPFNIAQYSILLTMVAQVTGLKPGTFYHNPADAHIYLDHLEQCNTVLNREPYPSPTLKLNPDVKHIDDFKFEDIQFDEYSHHDFVKAPISV